MSAAPHEDVPTDLAQGLQLVRRDLAFAGQGQGLEVPTRLGSALEGLGMNRPLLLPQFGRH